MKVIRLTNNKGQYFYFSNPGKAAQFLNCTRQAVIYALEGVHHLVKGYKAEWDDGETVYVKWLDINMSIDQFMYK